MIRFVDAVGDLPRSQVEPSLDVMLIVLVLTLRVGADIASGSENSRVRRFADAAMAFALPLGIVLIGVILDTVLG